MTLTTRQIWIAFAACAVIAALIVLRPFGAHTPYSSPEVSASLQQSLARLSSNSLSGRFYSARNHTPLWWHAGGVTADARAAMQVLAHAPDHGLPAQRYALPPAPPADAPAQDKARFELALTRAALLYASDMQDGMLRPASLFEDVSLKDKREDLLHGFSAAADSGAVTAYLQSMEPALGEYARLKSALARYRQMAQHPWPQVIAEKRPSPANLAALSQRLKAEGYNGDVPLALRAWKVRNGLDDNALLDADTVQRLNISAASRAEQIAVNMERWRWLPQRLESDRIMVNVPEATLQLIESDRVALSSRVVVGAPDKATPILSTRAVAVTINPSWHVPKSIVENEIKPKLEKNDSYLERKNMVMEDGEVTQGPGPDNALGLMKFEMPNDFDVYLHDTPSKHAFLADDRALSHGCVRVEQVRALVTRVLGLDEAGLDNLIATGETRRKPLSTALPVYIQYWTVLVGDDGVAGFRPDVYDRDQKMISRLREARIARN